MAKTRKKRTAYSLDQRKSILETAVKEGLTALQVRKKFGVTPVTYYSWRRKYGAARRHGSAPLAKGALRLRGAGLEAQVRGEVQTRVRAILPEIVRSEVNHYLDGLFGRSGRARKV